MDVINREPSHLATSYHLHRMLLKHPPFLYMLHQAPATDKIVRLITKSNQFLKLILMSTTYNCTMIKYSNF